jgi:cytochrome c peroxidase
MLGTAPIELGLSGHEERVFLTLAADRVYQPLFAAAFPGDSTPVTTRNIAAALSGFERSIVSFRSPFDRYRVYEQTGWSQDIGKFRVRTLRNIAVTAPYVHDGSIATLDEALDHYVAGGRTPNPLKSTGLQPLTLTAEERKDLIAFLESLTDREALRDPLWSSPWK